MVADGRSKEICGKLRRNLDGKPMIASGKRRDFDRGVIREAKSRLRSAGSRERLLDYDKLMRR